MESESVLCLEDNTETERHTKRKNSMNGSQKGSSEFIWEIMWMFSLSSSKKFNLHLSVALGLKFNFSVKVIAISF